MKIIVKHKFRSRDNESPIRLVFNISLIFNFSKDVDSKLLKNLSHYKPLGGLRIFDLDYFLVTKIYQQSDKARRTKPKSLLNLP